jgi:predicted dehydrogenase
MKEFKAVIAGAGFVGAAHAEALRRLGNVHVAALCDTVDAHAKALQLNIASSYTDYKEMIDRERPDAVHICTPNNLHKDIALYAIKKGINVICEKPLTATLEDAAEMTAAAKETGLINAVNFHNRFNPMTHQLRQMVKKGELGKIISVHGGYLQDWLFYPTDFNWRILSSESGKTRAVADIGSHWIDTAQYVTGLKVTEVMADFSTVYPVRKKTREPQRTFTKADENTQFTDVAVDTEDFAAALLRFENGAKGAAMISQVFAGKKNKISLFVGGTEQSAEWDMENAINEIKLGRRGGFNQIVQKDPGQLDPTTRSFTSYPGGHVEGFPDTFKQCFRQVYGCIEDKNYPHRDFAVFEDGYRQMLIAESLFESARTGRWAQVK